MYTVKGQAGAMFFNDEVRISYKRVTQFSSRNAIISSHFILIKCCYFINIVRSFLALRF